MNARPYYEFFAGGGMARQGLGSGWDCTFANDFSPMKAAVYEANWGNAHLHVGDVGAVDVSALPGEADLAWASFPCQDLSLAGTAAGLGNEQSQTRSGAFWSFWKLVRELREENRAPRIIVLENVYGALTSNCGRDFAAIVRALSLDGYRIGAMVLDAADFVPQSRPRIFIVAIRDDLLIPAEITSDMPLTRLHPPAMRHAIDRLAEPDREMWIWLKVPPSTIRVPTLASVIERDPTDVSWHSPDETARLLAMMSSTNRAKLAAMGAAGRPTVGTIYKRTRFDELGRRVQRAELRTDGVAGCLRTPGGGSSRQLVILVDGPTVKTRLMSSREAARLMGLPDSYRLPPRYNDAYHVAGDGLVVPVVRHLAENLLEPILAVNDTDAFLIAAE